MKAVLALIALAIFSTDSFGQLPVGFDLKNYGVRIEPDRRVMTVLAALETARTTNENGESVPILKTPLSAEGEKFRELLRSDLAKLNPALRDRISHFVLRHKRANPNKSDAEIVASFVSMAYALTPVPDLADPVVMVDLPGTLLDVLDFAPLVRDFYRTSSFAANLPEYVKLYSAAADTRLRTTTGDMVSELLSYLQTRPQLAYIESVKTETQKGSKGRSTISTVERRERERRFFIVPEMLAPTGNVIFLNVKDDYYAVVPPDTDITASEARRAYLQFVIDPLVLGSAKDIAVIRDGVKKLVDEARTTNQKVSPDVYLTISRSLVAAIDAKQTQNLRVKLATQQLRQKIDTKNTEQEKREVFAELERFKAEQEDEAILRLSEDYEKGAILVFYFADQLKGVENSGFDIAASMREMLLSFDPAKETGRYASFADARKRAIAARESRRAGGTETILVENPVTTRLIEIDKMITAKKLAEASKALRELVDKDPADARIYYNIGRVASQLAADLADPGEEDQLRATLLEAKVAYENVIRIAAARRTDAALVSLSYVALARIYEFFGDTTYAVGIYDAAIKVGDVTGGAYKEALAGKARLLRDQ